MISDEGGFNMKRVMISALFVLLAVILAVALVGCGSKKAANNTKSSSTTTQQGPVKSNSVSTPIAP